MAEKLASIPREVISAAGGIVVQQGEPPLFAVVCLRKRGDWVLPKGKLDAGETPRAAAQREVLEETGHDTEIGEFRTAPVTPGQNVVATCPRRPGELP